MRRALIGLLASASACEEEPCRSQPGFVCAVVGTGEPAFNRDGLPTDETHLFLASAARRGPDGVLYIVDFNNQRVRFVDDEGLVQTAIGSGEHAIATDGAGATDSPLENPIDFDFMSDGRLVFVSYHDPRVIVREHDGSLVAIAGAADGIIGITGDEGDGGPAVDALFIQLDGIAVAPDDTVYVSDSLANRVRRIRDGVIETVAGTGEAASTGDGGPGVDAALHWPSALALDATGNLLIAETRAYVVRSLAPDGTIELVAGTRTKGRQGDGGPATQAQLDQPYGLALDGDGNLYIADRGNFQIRRVRPDGILDTIAGTGHDDLTGDGGPATEARFGALARISVDDDSLLVADQGNSVVRRVNLR